MRRACAILQKSPRAASAVLPDRPLPGHAPLTSSRRRVVLGALVAVLSFAVVGTPARAVIVHDLFRVTLDAGSAPPATPGPLFATAARKILRRLGVCLSTSATLPAVSAVLADPRHWIAEYGYSRSAVTGLFRLWVRFDARDLMRTLLRGGVPVWGRERPRVLLLVVVPTSAGRRLLGATALGSLSGGLEKEAARRGFPVLLPVVDLGDLRFLAPGVLGSTPLPALARTFRRRYTFDALVAGSLTNLGSGAWRGRFRLWTPHGSPLAWRARTRATRRAVLTRLVRRLAGLFAARDALLPGGVERPVRVEVHGLEHLRDLVFVGRLLKRVLGVRRLALRSVRGRGTATWSFETRLPLGRLDRLLALSDRLAPLAPSAPGLPPSTGGVGRLRFRYVR